MEKQLSKTSTSDLYEQTIDELFRTRLLCIRTINAQIANSQSVSGGCITLKENETFIKTESKFSPVELFSFYEKATIYIRNEPKIKDKAKET